MYKNPGRALRGLAKFLCILGIVISVLSGAGIVLMGTSFSSTLYGMLGSVLPASAAAMLSNGGLAIGAGIAVALIGSVLAWLNNLLLAGIGTLIQNSTDIKRMMESAPAAPAAPVPAPAATPVPAPAITEAPAVAAPEPEAVKEAPVVQEETFTVPEETEEPAQETAVPEEPEKEPEVTEAPAEAPAAFVPDSFTEPEPTEAPATSATVVCPRCGKELPAGTRFCVYCGCKLV